MEVATRRHGGQRVRFYSCTSFWKRGSKVCSNNLVARMDVLDAEVRATLQDDVFRPSVIEEAIRLAVAELSPARRDDDRKQLEAELAAVRQECDRLAEAIGRGGPLDALLDRLTERQARCTALETEVAQRLAERAHVDLQGVERRLRAKLTDWRDLLLRNVQEGRAVLRTRLVGPLRFNPITEPGRGG